MKDIISGVGSGVAERISNPLGVSFVISWIVINYRFFLVLLSSMDTLEKFSYFEGVHFHGWNLLLLGALYPLAAATTYVFVFPHISKRVYKYWAGQQNKIKGVLADAEGTSPILQEEWRSERGQLLAEINRLQKEVNDKTLQVVKAREAESERDNLIVELAKKNEELILLQDEKDGYHASLISLTDNAAKLGDEKKELAIENARLNSELSKVRDGYFPQNSGLISGIGLPDLESEKYRLAGAVIKGIPSAMDMTKKP